MSNINDFGMPFTSQAGDRAYSALDWRLYFSALLEDGIIGDIGNELKVWAQPTPNKTVYVDTGAIFISGAMRVMTDVTNLSVTDNTSGQPRIDRIVARLNLSSRKIELTVRQGSAAVSPSPPDLVQDSATWEYSLAQIYLANGFSTIIAGAITDERDSEALCGYFRYRAKPAWYPGGDIPIDVWKYVLFKDQLTAEEIGDIEANPTLMDIIDNNEMGKLSLPVYNGGLSYEYIKLFDGLRFINTHGDLVFSSSGEFPSDFIVCDSLTINTGVTVTPPEGKGCQTLIVKGSLTLNGKLDGKGLGNKGPVKTVGVEEAGHGGAIFLILASNITGTGTIDIRGTDAIGSATYVSASRKDGSFYSEIIESGTVNTADSNITTSGIPGITYIANLRLYTFLHSLFQPGKTYLGAGHGGYYRGNNQNRPGGGGGAGAAGNGGAGGPNSGSNYGNSPGIGGGGGGALVLYSHNAIPAITIAAAGGNGTEGILAGHGGGGGGGLMYLFAVTDSSLKNVSGGIGAKTSSARDGSDGTSGLILFNQL